MLAQNMSGTAINSHLSAIGTFATWLNKPRPRSELISYIIKGESASAGPLPKSHVHHFPIVAAFENLQAVLNLAGPGMPWLSCAHLFMAMLQLIWPHRPQSLVSVCADSCYLADR